MRQNVSCFLMLFVSVVVVVVVVFNRICFEKLQEAMQMKCQIMFLNNS